MSKHAILGFFTSVAHAFLFIFQGSYLVIDAHTNPQNVRHDIEDSHHEHHGKEAEHRGKHSSQSDHNHQHQSNNHHDHHQSIPE